MNRTRRLVAVLTAVVAAGALAACSSSSNGSTSAGSTNSASTDAGVQEAKTLVAQYMKTPASIGITEAIKGTIPSGKTVAVMVCGQPACDVDYTYMADAASHLGWTAKKYIAGPTPDKNKAAWDLVVQEKPDAVISIGFPQALWAQDSNKLKDAGIPVVECCVADVPGNGVIFVENDAKAGQQGGKEQADWIIADSNGKANAVYLNIPAYSAIAAQNDGFQAEMKRICSGCKSAHLDLNVADVGTPAEKQAIVGYLQAHPKVDYLAVGDDDSFQGVPAALSAAGLSKIRAIGLAPSTANLNYIFQGQTEVATIGFPQAELSWKTVDVLARHFAGDSLDADKTLLPRLIFTKENIPDANKIPLSTPTYQADYLKLWGKS